MSSLTDNARLGAAGWFADEAASIATAAGADDLQPAVVERSAPPGHMPPLSWRDEDESYCVLEGEVTFFVDDETVSASAGDVVVAPAGAARTFRVESAGVRWTVLTRVASLERYLDFCRAVAEPLEGEPEWPSASELATVEAMAAANGIELLGPPGALPA